DADCPDEAFVARLHESDHLHMEPRHRHQPAGSAKSIHENTADVPSYERHPQQWNVRIAVRSQPAAVRSKPGVGIASDRALAVGRDLQLEFGTTAVVYDEQYYAESVPGLAEHHQFSGSRRSPCKEYRRGDDHKNSGTHYLFRWVHSRTRSRKKQLHH